MTLLLVDLDDTLLSRRDAFRAWAIEYLDEVGRPEELDWLVGADQNGLSARPELFDMMIDRLGLDQTSESLAVLYHDRFLSTFVRPPGVADALAGARNRGFKVAIVTNGEQRAQAAKIASAALEELVDVICISGVEGMAKPDPEFFRLAASRCGESLQGAWMIGDNPSTDIGGAHGLGLWTVWMRLDRRWPEELPYRPDHEADSFPEAVELVLSQT